MSNSPIYPELDSRFKGRSKMRNGVLHRHVLTRTLEFVRAAHFDVGGTRRYVNEA
jgi:hypothetical protein